MANYKLNVGVVDASKPEKPNIELFQIKPFDTVFPSKL